MKHHPPKPSSKKRTLSSDEKLVWKRHTEHDEKFREVELDEEGVMEVEEVVPEPARKTIRITENLLRPMPEPKKAALKPLEKSRTPDIDRRTAERFQRGKLHIDARLDLHGHGRESAYIHLLAFIHQSYQSGHRCVLIITGRGLYQKDKPAPERGVLRGLLKGWLNDPAIRPFILAFEQAQIKDGGEGAFYVLIKRKRT